MASPAVARRVAREMSKNYRFVAPIRKEISYRGGWQNATQKLQWFWYGFKKYGVLANLANMLRMREAWWESGEKRLIGMDAMGHRYWETDEMGRKWSQGYRWIDYPHHFQYADWSKIPDLWASWARHSTGRSPPQLAALHKELGPAWRDWNDHKPRSFLASETETFRNPGGPDGIIHGTEFTHPFDPEFKKARRNYGYSSRLKHMDITSLGKPKNLYDVDEFDPNDGAIGKLEYDGLSPSSIDSIQAMRTTDERGAQRKKMHDPSRDNEVMFLGSHDGGKKFSQIWWDYRKEQAQLTKESRQNVSAFDIAAFSPANKTGILYGHTARHFDTSNPNVTHTKRWSSNPLNPKVEDARIASKHKDNDSLDTGLDNPGTSTRFGR